jgi:hypothetical protein
VIYILRKYEDYFRKHRGYDGGKEPLHFTGKLWADIDGYLNFQGPEADVVVQVYRLVVYLQDKVSSSKRKTFPRVDEYSYNEKAYRPDICAAPLRCRNKPPKRSPSLERLEDPWK